jgi:hypothetical protein
MIFEKRPICFGDEFVSVSIPKREFEHNIYYTTDNGMDHSISFSDNDVKSIKDCVKKVYFNQPYTIVIWKDGTKTIVKCSNGCKYDKYTGLTTCFLKKFMGDCGFSKFKKFANNLIKDDE